MVIAKLPILSRKTLNITEQLEIVLLNAIISNHPQIVLTTLIANRKFCIFFLFLQFFVFMFTTIFLSIFLFLILQNKMETTNCCWLRAVSRSWKLCSIPATLWCSAIYWTMAVCTKSSRCTTISGRFVLSTSGCCSRPSKTATISLVSR